MISSQNNVRKYRTKGHEQVLSYLFIRQNGDSGKKYDNIINKAGTIADTKMKPRKSKAADKVKE